jgi:3-hydroxyisobutyrate dehydrogenase/2-hydroxy-3-oxopropionate reductase
VAVIGTGRMGAAMARRLAAAGFPLVTNNRTIEVAEELARELDAVAAATPGQAAGQADVVITSLADDVAAREVYLGGEGLVSGLRPGTVVLEMSTIDPLTVHEIGAAVDGTGAVMLDAPVSGSVSSVAGGTLTIMVGGDQAALERVKPVLLAMAAKVVPVGPRGAGSITKLAVNGLVHGLNVALSEALVLAEQAGVDRSIAYDVFASGAGGAPFVQYKREAYEDPDGAAVAFSLDLVEKDLELITGLAHRVGMPMEQAETGLEIVRKAIAVGMGDRDLSAIAVYLRDQAGSFK